MGRRLRDRVVRTAGTRGGLTLYELDRATEIRCARCAGRSVTKSVAVLGDDWTALWCKSCFLAMPEGLQPAGIAQSAAAPAP